MSLFVQPDANDGAAAAKPAANEAILPEPLQKAMGRLTEISSLPEITTHIVEVVEDPKSTAQDMHDIVKNDPALAAKILKVVNSAFYGLPSQVSSLDRAIVLLGLSAVKNIALAASLSRLFRPGNISARFAARDLWTHCIATGVCARMLAQAGFGHAEEAFVAGLVHDMGLLIEYQLFPEQLRAVVEEAENGSANFCALETAHLGADHQAFGEFQAVKWKFPAGLRYAIAYHHRDEQLKPELQRFITAVRVADTICCQNEIGFFLTALQQEISDDMLEIIGVSEDQVGELLESLPDRIAEAEAIFVD